MICPDNMDTVTLECLQRFGRLSHKEKPGFWSCRIPTNGLEVQGRKVSANTREDFLTGPLYLHSSGVCALTSLARPVTTATKLTPFRKARGVRACRSPEQWQPEGHLPREHIQRKEASGCRQGGALESPRYPSHPSAILLGLLSPGASVVKPCLAAGSFCP